MAAALLAAGAVLRVVARPEVVAVLQALLDLAARAVVAELRVLRAHKPQVALALPAAGVVLRAPLLLAVAAVLRVELLEVVVVLLELRRSSFSTAMARTTPCPAPAPTYEPVPRSR